MSASSEESGATATKDLPWIKSCVGDMCFTASGKRDECRPIVGAAVVERKGETKKALHVTLPKTVDTGRGVRVEIDEAEPIVVPFDKCHPVAGCTAVYEGGPELVDRLSHGRQLAIEATDKASSAVRVTLPLAGFAAAHDGPPMPQPKVFSEEVSSEKFRELQEQARKQEEEYERRCGPRE